MVKKRSSLVEIIAYIKQLLLEDMDRESTEK